jgi:hypothetical protein
MEEGEEQDEVQTPDEAVEDLDPAADDSEKVKGGVYQWWKKVETDG